MTNDALIDHPHTASCKNCGATTTGNFCHQCGQATHLHVPSAREFLHEFIGHYVALEGKLWNSLKLLLFKPGFLTREYIEGRRVRYVEPLRLYLTFSIIFFAVLKMSGLEMMNVGSSTAGKPAEISAEQYQDEDSEQFKKGANDSIKWLKAQNQRVGERAEHLLKLPRDEREATLKRTFYSYVPYAIFLMMPVFALYLKLLYLDKRRRYGEHFLFALHSNAFAFLMLSLFALADGWGFVRFVLLVWLVFYLPTAMRRVYGGGRTVTGLRWIVLLTLHVITLLLASILAVAGGLVV